MTRSHPDTIAAIATAPGNGGIGIVRVSGSRARAIAEGILGQVPAPRTAVFRAFHDSDGQTLDTGLALYFPGPASFTGEDVLELQGHGGREVLNLVLARTVQLGARLARPGEFSERAFLNDRLDLAQAEAIADLIQASSARAARAAVRSLQGEFSQRVRDLGQRLIQLRVQAEAAIDFADEDIDHSQSGHAHLAETLGTLRDDLTAIRAAAGQGSLLRDGLECAIVGAPNVGKSSLFNALSRQAAAIVTDTPGTTRDLLHADIQIDGLPVRLTDSAGLRDSDDHVEQEGISRARTAMAEADHMLVVLDATRLDSGSDELTEQLSRHLATLGLPSQTLGRDGITLVFNKIDQLSHPGDFPRALAVSWTGESDTSKVPPAFPPLGREGIPPVRSEGAPFHPKEPDKPAVAPAVAVPPDWGEGVPFHSKEPIKPTVAPAAVPLDRGEGILPSAGEPENSAAVPAVATAPPSRKERIPPSVKEQEKSTPVPVIPLSAKTGQNLDQLRQRLIAVAGFNPAAESTFYARRRHIDALDKTTAALSAASELLHKGAGLELIAEELRLAHNSLGTITGEVSSDDLLGEIFSTFCIGK